jgi:hypothetical protein
VATEPRAVLKEVLDKEPDYFRIPVKLNGKDKENIQRILNGREPLEDAELIVRVKPKV